MRGTVTIRAGSFLGIETEGYDYSIMELTGEHADVGDVLIWEGFPVDVECTNETRGIRFHSYFQDHGVNSSQIQSRLNAFRQ